MAYLQFLPLNSSFISSPSGAEQQGKLQFASPTAPNHEMQAYRTTESE